MRLDGKVALVTGGALRVGRYLSVALAKAGADVVVNYYRTPKEAEETKQEIEALGRRCLLIEASVAVPAESRAMIDEVEAEFGRLDILVHNAGNFNEAPFLEMTEESYDSSMNLILRGPFFLSQAAAKLMLKNGSGRIMAIVGNSLYENWPNFIPHALAKTGLAKLMQSLAIALSPKIQCNAICPATILPGDHGKDAEMRKSRGEEQENVNAERGVVLHAGNPEEVAELVVYLSGCSDYLTGAILPLDGGKSAL